MSNDDLAAEASCYTLKSESAPSIRRAIEPAVKVLRERGATYAEIHKFLASKGIDVRPSTLRWVGAQLRARKTAPLPQPPKQGSEATSAPRQVPSLLNDPDAVLTAPPSRRRIQNPLKEGRS